VRAAATEESCAVAARSVRRRCKLARGGAIGSAETAPRDGLTTRNGAARRELSLKRFQEAVLSKTARASEAQRCAASREGRDAQRTKDGNELPRASSRRHAEKSTSEVR
jgi:hypothetical protein